MNWRHRIERLERLRVWAEQERDQVSSQLAALEEQKQALSLQVDQLKNYLGEYVDDMGKDISFVSQLVAQHEFVERINQAITATLAKISPLDDQIDGLQKVFAEKQQRVRLLEILSERWQKSYQKHLSKQEQQMLDEWVQQKNSNLFQE
ncbi:flagellar export protein FliJ [Thiomicrospira sp. ALE5]|uniref:flagellar export protein FliJ n=1 Tax=Thiomicrospira sp. ALE5 TaxID=748650 RepID=UPI0008E679A3|nr:flagellar export protein FliJ [Thiomicrospira sp. ALE5]SFR59246.1 flagellar export protein FliJ [Thiomicrospira sp. ALE5]